MSDQLAPVIVQRDLRTLARLPINARVMTQSTYQQLVANIRRDGCLTSVPLIWQCPEEGYPEGGELILSGNHRADAAVDAEVYTASCMLITGPMSTARRLAMQISHNAIEGHDDPATLAQLYESIDELDWRTYAGLDDKELGLLAKVDLEGLSEANLDFATVQLIFLPDELEAARAALDTAMTSADATWLAAMDQYDAVLDALASVHAAHNVGNVATALGLIIATFERHLDELADGYLDPAAEEPRHKGRVGWEAVFGGRTLPAATAVTLTRALRRAEERGDAEPGEGWQLVDKLAADYLETQR